MPARNTIAKASRASYNIDNNRLAMLGTAGSAWGAAPGCIEAGYGFAGLGAGAMPEGASDGAPVGDLEAPRGAGGLGDLLPSLRRSCSGRRLYSSHCFVSPCFLSGGNFSIFL